MPVNGYEGLYEVSDLGRVRSLTRPVKHSTGGYRVFPGRVLKQDTTLKGYKRVPLSKDGASKNVQVHRIVCRAFNGAPPTGKNLVLHANGDPGDNRVSNLRWGTQAENIQDSVRQGTHVNTRKVLCVRGHQLEGENVRIDRRGRRECLPCKKIRNDLNNSKRAGIRSG